MGCASFDAISICNVCDGSARFASMTELRSMPCFSASFSMSSFTHLSAASVRNSCERMYMTRPCRRRGRLSKPFGGFRQRCDGAGHHVLALEELEPGVERAGPEDRGQLGR